MDRMNDLRLKVYIAIMTIIFLVLLIAPRL